MGNRIILLVLVSLLLAGCARTSSMMMSKDVVQITVNAPPVCGAEGAQKVATRRAAIETLKNGFDEYLIIGVAPVSWTVMDLGERGVAGSFRN